MDETSRKSFKTVSQTASSNPYVNDGSGARSSSEKIYTENPHWATEQYRLYRRQHSIILPREKPIIRTRTTSLEMSFRDTQKRFNSPQRHRRTSTVSHLQHSAYSPAFNLPAYSPPRYSVGGKREKRLADPVLSVQRPNNVQTRDVSSPSNFNERGRSYHSRTRTVREYGITNTLSRDTLQNQQYKPPRRTVSLSAPSNREPMNTFPPLREPTKSKPTNTSTLAIESIPEYLYSTFGSALSTVENTLISYFYYAPAADIAEVSALNAAPKPAISKPTSPPMWVPLSKHSLSSNYQSPHKTLSHSTTTTDFVSVSPSLETFHRDSLNSVDVSVKQSSNLFHVDSIVKQSPPTPVKLTPPPSRSSSPIPSTSLTIPLPPIPTLEVDVHSSTLKQKPARKQPRILKDEFYGADFSFPTSESTKLLTENVTPGSNSETIHPSEEEIRRASLAVGVPLRTALNIATSAENTMSSGEEDADVEKQGTVFIAALNSIAKTKALKESVFEYAGVEASKGQHGLKMGLPGADPADVFSRVIGKKPGIEIFRIEKFRPVPVRDDMFGVFSVGDCYIVLLSHWSPKNGKFDEISEMKDGIRGGWVTELDGLMRPCRIVGERKRRFRRQLHHISEENISVTPYHSSLKDEDDEISRKISEFEKSDLKRLNHISEDDREDAMSSTPTSATHHAVNPDVDIPPVVSEYAEPENLHLEILSDDDTSRNEYDNDYSDYSDDESHFSEYEYDEFDDGASCASSTGSRTLHHQIFTWIGPDAELDKRFCSAMYAVALRDYLGSSAKIERATYNDESYLFKNVFDQFEPAESVKSEEESRPKGALRYVDAEFAADSSLSVQEDESDPDENDTFRDRRDRVRVYQVDKAVWGRDIRLRLVEPSSSSLKSNLVCIIETSREIYQWNGADAGLNLRSKSRILVSKMTGGTKKGLRVKPGTVAGENQSLEMKIRSTELDQDMETPRFRSLFGEKPALAIIDNEAYNLFKEVADKPASLYEILDTLHSEPEQHLVAVEGLANSSEVSRVMLNDGRKQVSVGLKRTLLNTHGCMVLDAGVEMFLWIGKESTLQTRAASRELLARIVPLQKRPKWVGLHKIAENAEPEVFKIRFPDWDAVLNSRAFLSDAESDESDGEKNGRSVSTRKRKRKIDMKVDVRALYATNKSASTEEKEFVEKQLAQSNALLVSMSSFIYRRNLGRFVRMPDESKGHFFENDAYVFLCVYQTESSPTDLDEYIAESVRRSSQASTIPPHLPDDEAEQVNEEQMHMQPHLEVELPSPTSTAPLSEPSQHSPLPENPSFNLPPPAPPFPETLSVPHENTTGYDSDPESGNETDSESSSVASYYEPPEPARRSSVMQVALSARLRQKSFSKRRNRSSSCSSNQSSSQYSKQSGNPPKVECVVYFWQGQSAPRLAYSTFKFKTQVELESLVQDLYGCPVRVVNLQPMRESVKFLAHLENSMILYRNNDSIASTNVVVGSGGAAAAKEIATVSGRIVENSGYDGVRMYHIRTDRNFTTRAIEVVPVSESLVMRDCFFIHGSQFATKDTVDDDNVMASGYLWIGKGASSEEARFARNICDKIVERRRTLNGGDAEEDNVMGLYYTIEEGLEPDAFWRLLRNNTDSSKMVHATGAEYYFRQPPRFFRCSCASGIFAVTEIDDFQQGDLLTDTCVILDPGSESGETSANRKRKAFVWVGTESSDVVRKLCRKSLDVWFRNLGDGRVVGDSGWWDSDSSNDSEGDVEWVIQGKERMEFRAFFHGWWWDPATIDSKPKKRFF